MLHLQILTPQKEIFSGKVHIVTLPGSEGYFSVQDNHVPMITALKTGDVSYQTEKEKHTFSIEQGMVEVYDNQLIVLLPSFSHAA